MSIPHVVMDSSVLVGALRSRRGASHKLLGLMDSGKYQVCIAVPLLLVYQDVVRALLRTSRLTEKDLSDILDYLCRMASPSRISYLWRPFLQDPHHDMALELAVAAGCDLIVTHNLDAFRGAELLGVRVVTPKELLQEIGETL